MRTFLALFLLSAPLAAIDSRCPSPAGLFSSSAVTPTHVVCLVDYPTPTSYALWSVPIAGGAPVRLSQVMAADRDVILFRVSPDGGSVAFTCDPVQWTKYELHTVLVAGGPVARISGAIEFDHDVDGFVWSTRGDQVVFRYGRNATGAWVLYAVPQGGGFRTMLHPAPVHGGAVGHGFGVELGTAWFSCDCVTDETVIEYEVPLPGTIFGDGFESGGTGAWR